MRRAAERAGTAGIKVNLDSDSFDVVATLKDGRLWFAWPDGLGTDEAPSGASWPEHDAATGATDIDALAALLRQIGKAVNLVRLAGRMMASAPSRPLVSVSGELNPSVAGRFAAEDAVGGNPAYAAADECKAAAYQGRQTLEHHADVKQCDKVTLSLDVATGRYGTDVNVIYVDAHFGIHVSYRHVLPTDSGSVRIAHAYEAVICSDCPSATAGAPVDRFEGSEAVIVMSAPARKDTAPFDLEGVEQATTQSGKGHAAPAADALMSLLIGDDPTTHAVSADAREPEAQIYLLRVLPREVPVMGQMPSALDERGVHPEGALGIFLRTPESRPRRLSTQAPRPARQIGAGQPTRRQGALALDAGGQRL